MYTERWRSNLLLNVILLLSTPAGHVWPQAVTHRQNKTLSFCCEFLGSVQCRVILVSFSDYVTETVTNNQLSAGTGT